MKVSYIFKEGDMPKPYQELKAEVMDVVKKKMLVWEKEKMTFQDAREYLINVLMKATESAFCAIYSSSNINKENFEENVDEFLTIMRNDMLNMYDGGKK